MVQFYLRCPHVTAFMQLPQLRHLAILGLPLPLFSPSVLSFPAFLFHISMFSLQDISRLRPENNVGEGLFLDVFSSDTVRQSCPDAILIFCAIPVGGVGNGVTEGCSGEKGCEAASFRLRELLNKTYPNCVLRG